MSEEIRPEADKVGELSRRDLLRGSAAAGIVIGADSYVKPALKHLGVSRLNAANSAPPIHVGPPAGDGNNNNQNGQNGQNGQGGNTQQTGQH
jgi:hypothetical protein